MKKLITFITALTLTASPLAANAALQNRTVQPTIAILDTALDTSLPIFQDKIEYEVCILEYASCENGKKFMEGQGAATMPLAQMKLNGFEHGTMMASAAIQANPNVKIVFVRIVAQNLINGFKKPLTPTGVGVAMQWVAANKDKFNIQAVAMSQGTHALKSGTDYCPKEVNTENAIKSLLASGVPTFFAVGNSRDYKRIDWPSCIPDSVAVGGTDQIGEIASYNNYDVLLDIYAQGFGVLTAPGGVLTNQIGSSIATQFAAMQYLAVKSMKPGYSHDQIYNLIIATANTTKSARVPSGKAINLQGALNG